MSVSYISEKTKLLLWGKAGGRCQYRGCNACLYRDDLTQFEFNKAYIAHIVADKPGGPRGDKVRSRLLKKELSNLMLMCDEHHRLIDRVDVAGHPEPLLLEMKAEHEERIERITGISANRKRSIITYKANVGKHTPQLSYEILSPFLLSEGYYPAENQAIDLSLSNSPQRDKNPSFWSTELENLETQFNEQLRPKLRKGTLGPVSLFAFAPMPLLIKFGTLINDIKNIEIHQPIRDPKTWNWTRSGDKAKYNLKCPRSSRANVALNISLSATINNDRITEVLGDNCSIYTLTIDRPFNDFLKNKKQLQEFSIEMRLAFDKIKSKFGSKIFLNVFPAMPIATAIELGRIWMPKADMPLIIYDENTASGGFIKTIEINNI